MKKALSAILSLILVVSCVAASFAAAFPDTNQHWADSAVSYMVGKKILNGYEDGTFRPDRTVSRVEYVKMLDETFGLTETAAISYRDVADADWFYLYVQKAAAQGYLLNYGSQLNPNGALSRQEAAALLVRYLALDPAKKAASSTYADYSSISVNYRDYVLQATAAGLFKGYEDNTFRPNNTLTRAEALTILYRAAGSIYADSATGKESGAYDGNAVVTRSGVTVTDAKISGRMIVGEGVKGGTVTLSGCDIGELELRGTASVILSDCWIGTMHVDSAADGHKTSVSMLGSTTANAVTLDTPAEISLGSAAKIPLLTVNAGAKDSSVTGTGTLTQADIKASGFSADKVPTRYTIADKLTATFAGAAYSSGSTTTTSAFSKAPETYATTSSCYLTATPSVSGTLYVYFTNTATAPTAATFDSLYGAAAVKTSFTVTARSSFDRTVAATTNVSAYPYAAIMVKSSAGSAYQPVVVPNTASSGFTVAPTASVTGTTDYLSYTAAVSGKLFYFYTTSPDVLTVTAFSSQYNSSAYRGSLDVTAGQSAAIPLQQASLVANFPYIAVMLSDSTSGEFMPKIVSRTTSAVVGSGFSIAPSATTIGASIYLVCTPQVAGTVEYYLSAANTAPSAAQFDSLRTIAQAQGLAGTTFAAAGSSTSFTIPVASVLSYPYAVVRLTANGVSYQPVAVSLLGGTGTGTTANSGFAYTPTLGSIGGKYTINCQTITTGLVYYYLTNSTTPDSNASTFWQNYTSKTSSRLEQKLGGSFQSNGGYQVATTVLPTSLYQEGFTHMAILFGGQRSTYAPIVIELTAVAATSDDTGFAFGPTYSGAYDPLYPNRHRIEFITNESGTVYYLFTDTNNVTGSDVMAKAQLDSLNGVNTPYSGSVTVTKGMASYVDVQTDSSLPPYVALVLFDQNNTPRIPVVISTSGTASFSSSGSTGFGGQPTVNTASTTSATLNYNSQTYGKLYYFFSAGNVPQLPNAVIYQQYYINNVQDSYKGEIEINTVGSGTATLSTKNNMPISSMTYVVLLLQGAAGEYYAPVMLQLNGGTGSGSGSFIQSGFSSMPYVMNNTLYYRTLTTGTLYYGFTASNDGKEFNNAQDMAAAQMGLSGLAGGSQSMIPNPYQQVPYYGGTLNPSAMIGMLSSMVASTLGGGSASILGTLYGTDRMVPLSQIPAGKNYMVVWIINDSKLLPNELYIPLSGSSYYPGAGTTTGTSGFALAPTLSNGTVVYIPSVSGTVKYFYTNTNYGTAMNGTYFDMYAQQNYGSTQSVTAGTQGTIPVFNNFAYLWLYLVPTTPAYSVTYSPVCVTLTGTGTGTGIGGMTGGTGFATQPVRSGSSINFATASAGFVGYFFTNDTMTYTSANFQEGSTNAGNANPNATGLAMTNSIPIVPNYKYVWLMFMPTSATSTVSYTPVCVQLY